jgi:PAS domain S-box-containing protein
VNWPARYGLVAFVAGTVLAIGLTAVLWLDVMRRIDELAVTRSDNTQWTISQLEVDYLRLALAAEGASAGRADALDGLRQRFDIFYSRWRTLGRAEAYSRLAEDPEYQDAAREIDRFLDRGVALVDGPDAVLRAALPDLRTEIDGLHGPVRSIALRGVDIFAEVSDRQRAEIVTLILRTGLGTVLLLLVLAIAAFLMIEAGRRARATARKLEEANLNLAMIVDTSLDAIVVTDEDGIVRVYNPAAETVFGWSRDEAIGQPMTRLMIPARHHAAHEAGMKRFLETGEKRVIGKGRIQLDARHKSGRIFPVELSIAHEHTAKGHVFVSFLRDITHRRQTEDDLRTARDEALAAARTKSEFLAIMSHEIRTPLNGILGSIDLLRDGALDDAQQRLVATMRESGEILLGHVNDVLSLTRLETGQATLSLLPVDLRTVFAKVLENQAGAAQEAGNSMTMDVAPDVPGAVSADERRLSQILLNLVGNANKFTSNGAITLSARCVRRTDETVRVAIGVADTGVGIPAEDRGRVFEDFVMLDTSYHRNAPGAGLGLGITRRIVHAMGGTIEIRDAPGGGANFHIELDLDLAVGAPPDALCGGDAEGQAFCPRPLSVLVVEDNEINRSVLRAMLEREGHRVVEACDGQAGVDAAGRQRFDLILMDISMPGMNGTVAARAIRDGDGPNASTPMVAATAHALPDEIEAFRAHGMDRTLTKPIQRSALRALLAELSQQPAGHEIDPRDAPDAAVLLDVEKLVVLSETWGQDRFRERLAQFSSETTAFEQQFLDNPSVSEPGTLAAQAHRLAGAAGSLGFPAANARLVELETVWKTTGRLPDRILGKRVAYILRRTREEICDLLETD